ncbi:8 TM domain-containing transmembrane protein [Acrasis kona]|uniref:8 TM domain-containing transmembrane protein n=1 Tax=Acrasis kona TaxID=1008807 RepID=A0AAW2Z4U4_9EUKA
MAVPGQRNKLLLESIPIPFLIALFVVFMGVVGVIASVSSFYPDMYENYETRKEFSEVFSGKKTIEVSIEDLSTLNQEISFSLVMIPRKDIVSQTGFTTNLMLRTKTYTSGQTGEYETAKSRKIVCNQLNEKVCDASLLFKEPWIKMADSLINLEFVDNPQSVIDLFEPKFDLLFSYISQSHSLLEITTRYLFLAISLSFLILFVLVNRMRQHFNCWHDEQRWVAVLLAGLVAFNNPFYILQYYASTEFFTILNITLRVSFILLMMLWLLFFTHGLYVQPKDRSFAFYYVPKVAVILLLWIMSMFSFTYATERNIQDPTYSYKDDFQEFSYIQASSVTLTIIYLLMLGYYVLRTFGLYDMLPVKFTGRFKIVWGMTILVVVASTITLLALKTLHLLTQAMIYLSFQSIFNMYVCLLSLVFLASNQPETVRDMSDVPLVGVEDD